jgi:hypothetical protein
MHKTRRERRNPGDGQQHIDERAKQVVEKGKRPRRDVPVRFFQVDLIRLAAHWVPAGYTLN